MFWSGNDARFRNIISLFRFHVFVCVTGYKSLNHMTLSKYYLERYDSMCLPKSAMLYLCVYR